MQQELFSLQVVDRWRLRAIDVIINHGNQWVKSVCDHGGWQCNSGVILQISSMPNIKEPLCKLQIICAILKPHILLELQKFNILPDVWMLDGSTDGIFLCSSWHNWKYLQKITTKDCCNFTKWLVQISYITTCMIYSFGCMSMLYWKFIQTM